VVAISYFTFFVQQLIKHLEKDLNGTCDSLVFHQPRDLKSKRKVRLIREGNVRVTDQQRKNQEVIYFYNSEEIVMTKFEE
jgi:hypothetical protein